MRLRKRDERERTRKEIEKERSARRTFSIYIHEKIGAIAVVCCGNKAIFIGIFFIAVHEYVVYLQYFSYFDSMHLICNLTF